MSSSSNFDRENFARAFIVPEFTRFPIKRTNSESQKITQERDAQEASSSKRLKHGLLETNERDSLDSDAVTSTGSQLLEVDDSETQAAMGDVNAILFDGTFYEIVQKMQKTEYQRDHCGIVALCKFCPNFKEIKGSFGVSYNFIYHLKHKHPQQFNEFNLRQVECVKSTTNVDEKLLKFVAETYMPLDIVEHPSFIDLFEATGIQLIDRECLEKLLDQKYKHYVDNIKENLSSVSHCCATVDVWSSARRWSFLAYTCHWLDSKTLERRSAALACRRFDAKTLSSNETIKSIMSHVQYKYNLDESKILRISTENMCNSEYKYRQLTTNEDHEIMYEDYAGTTVFIPSIPKQFRCVSHALSELARKDFLDILEKDETLLSRHQHAFTRFFSLRQNSFNCITKSTINSWINLFDSIQEVLANKEQLPVYYHEDINYLEDYCDLMMPIAEALKFLQRKKNMYFGDFMATLVSLKVKLGKLHKSKQLKYLQYACKELEYSLYRRFQNYFEISDDEALEATIAAISCPDVKGEFFKILLESAKNYTVGSLKQAFKRYAAEFMSPTEQSSRRVTNSCSVVKDNEENFFDFGETQANSHDELQFELEKYLTDIDSSLDCLKHYPTIRQMFLKYNTPIVSSAAVERLFSFTDILKRSQQQNLSDEQFEKLVLINADKEFVKPLNN